MDTGRIKKWVEQQSADTAEWSVKGTPEAEETSELEPSGMNTTTEPRDGVVHEWKSVVGTIWGRKMIRSSLSTGHRDPPGVGEVEMPCHPIPNI